MLAGAVPFPEPSLLSLIVASYIRLHTIIKLLVSAWLDGSVLVGDTSVSRWAELTRCVVMGRTILLLLLVLLHADITPAQNSAFPKDLWAGLLVVSSRPAPPDIAGVLSSTAAGPRVGESSSRDVAAAVETAPPAAISRSKAPAKVSTSNNFHWSSAINQSFRFLLIEHAFRIAKEPTTRSELGGPFVKDYFESVKGLGGFSDGDEFYINYVGHPMEGAVAGFIEVQNDPRGSKMQFGQKGYWKNRLRALAFATVYSTQFEIGPISEASIGNVGRDRRKDLPNGGQGFVDLVITPTVGTAWLVGEDMVDHYVIAKLERKTSNRFLQMMLRGLNPCRDFTNMLRGKVPWHRDTRGGVWRPSQQVATYR